jgi:hypothetical protein
MTGANVSAPQLHRLTWLRPQDWPPQKSGEDLNCLADPFLKLTQPGSNEHRATQNASSCSEPFHPRDQLGLLGAGLVKHKRCRLDSLAGI